MGPCPSLKGPPTEVVSRPVDTHVVAHGYEIWGLREMQRAGYDKSTID